ncbi:MAG TPA: MoaD/ThiS family protein [Gemmatimonadales bacterium]|jgi:molybdopterin converting factor small subunit|nr:MoaD/ThiS family protein [Gemmatimonadales bacterium]
MSKVSVRFFASYADLAGCAWSAVTLETPATVADVIARVREVFPGTRDLPPRPLAALNQRHVKLDALVNEGDEVALLPPLAGG